MMWAEFNETSDFVRLVKGGLEHIDPPTAIVKQVFNVELDDVSEVHLHPGDLHGAIVSLSQTRPPASWRWGGEGWQARAVPGAVTGITVAVAEPDAVRRRWETVADGPVPGVSYEPEGDASGVVAIELDLGGVARTLDPAHL